MKTFVLSASLLLALVGAANAPASQPFLALDAGGHTARGWSVLFTPGDRELVSVSEDKTVRIWDVISGEPIRTIRLPIGLGIEGKRYSAAMFPDGKRLAVAGLGPRVDDNLGAIYIVSL